MPPAKLGRQIHKKVPNQMQSADVIPSTGRFLKPAGRWRVIKNESNDDRKYRGVPAADRNRRRTENNCPKLPLAPLAIGFCTGALRGVWLHRPEYGPGHFGRHAGSDSKLVNPVNPSRRRLFQFKAWET
jgi:hypothetical protein